MEGILMPVVLLQCLVDFLLLFGTDRLSGGDGNGLRCALGAALGAAQGALCLRTGHLAGLPWRVGVLALMALTAFGPDRHRLTKAAVFLLLQLGLMAIALGLRRWGMVWLPVLALLLLLLRGSLGQMASRAVELRIAGAYGTVNLLALRDTGNTLRDPVTGEPVLVISADAARTLTGLSREQLRRPLETLTSLTLPGLRLVPYRSVGGSGFLLALRFPEVRLGRRKGSALVAFAPEGFEKGDAIQALTGGSL